MTTLHNFDNTDGSLHQAALVEATDGNFYGTTYEGGANSGGTVFKVMPGGTLTTLYSSAPSAGGSSCEFFTNLRHSRYGEVASIPASGTTQYERGKHVSTNPGSTGFGGLALSGSVQFGVAAKVSWRHRRRRESHSRVHPTFIDVLRAGERV